jgi:uncharacterized protein YndB with AHSA1/START domain
MDQTILIERVISAPRERVYKAMLDPKDLVHWHHADESWTTPYAESDARNGGKFKIGFKSPDGKNDFDFEGVYNDLVEPERIVYTIGDGRPVTILLSEEDGKTKVSLTLTLEGENSAEQQREGWGLMLKHLGEYLERT